MDVDMGNSENELCQICKGKKKRYQCPKCNILYCSLECYKSPTHLTCSEEFYKSCVAEHIQNDKNKPGNDIQKMIDILKRLKQADLDGELDFSEDPLEKEIDSDDDLPESRQEDTEEDLAERLQGVDLDDTEEVWNRLTASEKVDFEKMVETGEIFKLVPDVKPWWLKADQKIVDLSQNGTDNNASKNIMPTPEIWKNIPSFSEFCKKEPSPCVHFNLWNIMAGYSCIIRHYLGDHLKFPIQASAQLVNICVCLKFGTNFDDVDDAITSVLMETLTTKTRTDTLPEETIKIESREFLLNDARLLMSSRDKKLSALSDILNLLKLGKKELQNPENADMFKLFALCSGSVELDRKKITHLIKKIEFLLSYVDKVDAIDLP